MLPEPRNMYKTTGGKNGKRKEEINDPPAF
jgi:hypothetical protein